MMYGLIEHLLELHGVFSDSNMARRGEVGLLDDLTPLPTMLNMPRKASLKASTA